MDIKETNMKFIIVLSLLCLSGVLEAQFTASAGSSKTGRTDQKGSTTRQDKGRPNILFLLSDDQRWNTLGCLGNAVVQTPNLDSLADKGFLFENCFATTSICCVSRASIMTGQYARSRGTEKLADLCSTGPWEQTLPGLLKQAGYINGYIGKYNIGEKVGTDGYVDSDGQRYDFWAGWQHHGNYWHDRSCPNITNDGIHNKTDNHCTCPPDGELPRVGYKGIKDPVHTTVEIVPQKVAQFLNTRDTSKPFLLTVGFKSPKDPWDDYPEDLAELYEGARMPIPKTATTEAASKLPLFLRKSLASAYGLSVVKDRDLLSQRIRYYYRQVTSLDRTIGKIRSLLEEYKVADNTVIIFMSDNGHFLGDQGFWGKWLAYDASIRVPCLMYDPRRPVPEGGIKISQMVLNIDIAPTILSLAGENVPQYMQGKDMNVLISNRKVQWRNSFFYDHTWTASELNVGETIEPTEAVRTNRWKYINYIKQNPPYEQLFDLSSDPDETKNLAALKEYKDILMEMRNTWKHYRNELTLQGRQKK